VTARRDASSERRWIVVLAIFAALRLIVLAHVFPYFTNVDEHRHLDATWKYARGQLPDPEQAKFDEAVAELVWLWASPEYMNDKLREPGAVVRPPLGALPRVELRPAFRKRVAEVTALVNHMVVQPPTYYVLSAPWLVLGRAAGVPANRIVYWQRLPGAGFAAALIFVAWALLRRTHPDDSLARLGIPALLAVFPQDAWHSVSNDALSPLMFGASFAFLVRLHLDSSRGGGTLGRPAPGWLAAASGGLLVGLTFLTKYPNLPIVVVAAWVWLRRVAPLRGGVLRSELPRLAAFWGAAALPVLLWCGRNLVVFGDPTGTWLAMEWGGWTNRPLGEWLDHPITSLEGLRHFFSGLAVTYWRGEIVWHGERLRAPLVDTLYMVTWGVAVVVGGVAWLTKRKRPPAWQAEGLALLAIAAAVAVLASLSMAFQFPEWGIPSAARPFILSGRYVGGTVLPFMILLIAGVRALTGWLPVRAAEVAAWALVSGLAALVLVGELALVAGAGIAGSPYNALHLP
jgi:hypothetical protein